MIENSHWIGLITGGLTIFLYLCSSFMIVREQSQRHPHSWSIFLGYLAVLAHTIHNGIIFLRPEGIDFSFFHTASLVLLIVVILLLITPLRQSVIKLGVVVFPLAALILTLCLVIPVNPQFLENYSLPMKAHILSSIIAFSLLSIAALQALLLALQDKQLRNRQPQRLINSLPSLQTMESLLFQMISMGLLFLSLSLISGFVFIDDVFAQHLVHKTLLSILAWLIFCGLLAGRYQYGWRGKTAIRWTLSGFVLLLLAYFGSKLVLEVILNRG